MCNSSIIKRPEECSLSIFPNLKANQIHAIKGKCNIVICKMSQYIGICAVHYNSALVLKQINMIPLKRNPGIYSKILFEPSFKAYSLISSNKNKNLPIIQTQTICISSIPLE